MAIVRVSEAPALTAEEIRTLRRHLGLTHAEFAARLGFTRETVGKWESGRIQPSTEAVTAIRHLLAQIDGPGRP